MTNDTETLEKIYELHLVGRQESQERIREEAQERLQREKLLQRWLQTDRIRVHDLIIQGNVKTKASVIEVETARLKEAANSSINIKELMELCKELEFKLLALDIFDSVKIMLDSGPPELPDTCNVIIDVVETKKSRLLHFDFSKERQARFSTVYKNAFGFGDLWDASLAYGGDRMAEASAGVHLPRFEGLKTPTTARVFLHSQDCLKFSSFNEQSFGLSLGLLSNKNHNLAYNLAWRTLTDPSQMASRSVRSQLGHSLLSSLKYTFKIDNVGPKGGYAFASTTQLAGLAPDSRSLRFLRQEFDIQYDIPLGYFRSALNVGISAGVIFPWGAGFTKKPSPLPERFSLGGVGGTFGSSDLGRLYGFRRMGISLTESRRDPKDGNRVAAGRDRLGGDFALTAFADLSFDLPSKWCQENGIRGHMFASSGNVGKITENAYKSFSFTKFADSFRTTVGAGIILPTPWCGMEINYCHVLKDFDYDRKRSGFGVSFSI